MVQIAAIDGDGHITESNEQLAPYMRGAWSGRRDYYPGDGWDRSMAGTLGTRAGTAAEWLEALDHGGMEMTILYPDSRAGHRLGAGAGLGSGALPGLQRFHRRRDPEGEPSPAGRLPAAPAGAREAIKELRRAVTQLGFCGAMLPANGLRLPLGHPMYHPIYAEAERLDTFLGVHATVRGPESFGADQLDKFIEVHTLSIPSRR